MIGFFVGIILSLIFIYPVFQGLILLPLDLLVSNSAPWFLANQILIKNSYMLDSIIQMYPWRHMTFASLTSGILPLWNPYQFAGLPFMASMKPMVFYPFNLLFFLGEINAWNALLFFQLFLAFYFMYLLMRKFSVSIWGSLLSSIAFAYSSLMIGFLQFGSDGHALVWLPLFLYAIKSYVDSHRVRYLILLSISIACAVFAGHLQFFGYQCLSIAAFTIWYVRQKNHHWGEIILVGAAALIGIGISAIQLVPGIELFRHSYRGIADTTKVFSAELLKPQYLFRLFSPDFFGSPVTKDLHIGYIETSGYFGIVPLFFALYVFTEFKKNAAIRFFAILALLALIFSFEGPAKILYMLRIPLITNGTGGRLFSLVLFTGAVLAGFGLDAFIASRNNRRTFMLYMGFCVLTLGVLFGAFMLNKHIFFGATFANLKYSFVIAAMFLAAGLFYFFTQKYIKKISVVAILLFLFIAYGDLFRMGYRFLTFSNPKFLYPDIPVIEFVRGQTSQNLSRVYGLAGSELPSVLRVYTVETYNPLYPMRTGMFLKALEGKDPSDIPSNVFMFGYSEGLKHVLDVLGVSYIATENDQNPSVSYFRSSAYEKDMNKVYSDERHDVYLNTAAYPRFSLYYHVVPGMTEEAILDDIQKRTTDLRTTLLLEEQLPQVIGEGTGSAVLTRSDLNSQEFAVETSVPAFLYVSDAHFPGWKAFVDGKESHIYRANYNFRAVLVPQGSSRVIFRYEPVSYETGRRISVISVFLLGLLFLGNSLLHKVPQNIEKKKPRSDKRKPRSPKK